MRATPYAVDMDGNPMAAGRSVLRIIQEMKRGKHSFIAPDGPGGPVGERSNRARSFWPKKRGP
jgi:hypothetical protein